MTIEHDPEFLKELEELDLKPEDVIRHVEYLPDMQSITNEDCDKDYSFPVDEDEDDQ